MLEAKNAINLLFKQHSDWGAIDSLTSGWLLLVKHYYWVTNGCPNLSSRMAGGGFQFFRIYVLYSLFNSHLIHFLHQHFALIIHFSISLSHHTQEPSSLEKVNAWNHQLFHLSEGVTKPFKKERRSLKKNRTFNSRPDRTGTVQKRGEEEKEVEDIAHRKI